MRMLISIVLTAGWLARLHSSRPGRACDHTRGSKAPRTAARRGSKAPRKQMPQALQGTVMLLIRQQATFESVPLRSSTSTRQAGRRAHEARML